MGVRVDEPTFRSRADELRERAYRAMAKIPPAEADDFFYGPFATQMRWLQQQVEDAVRRNDRALATWLRDPGADPRSPFAHHDDPWEGARMQRQASTRGLYRLIERGDLNLGSSGGGAQDGET